MKWWWIVLLGAILVVLWTLLPRQRAGIMEVSGSKMYLEPQFGSVSKTSGVVYSVAPAYKTKVSTSLALDVYQPVGDERTQRPAIILVHGGGFATGNKGIYDEAKNGGLFGWGKYFAERGYVVFSVDYRLGEKFLKLDDPELEEVVAMATSDVLASVRFIKLNADKYRINPSKIAVGGNSAGAVLALYAAYDPGAAVGNMSNPGADSLVRASIALSGTLGPKDLNLIEQGAVSAIIFAGVEDKTVPYTWSMAVKDRLKSVGSRVDWYSYPGVGHEVAGYTQVAPQIANFLYQVLELDQVVAKSTPTPSVEPIPSQLSSLSPSPSLAPNVVAKASIEESPVPSIKPSQKAVARSKASPAPSLLPSPTPVLVLERMAPEDFVWHGGATASPIVESNVADVAGQGLIQKLWESLITLIDSLF